MSPKEVVDRRDALVSSAWLIIAGLISGLLEFWMDRPFRYPGFAERSWESALAVAFSCASWYGISSRRRPVRGAGVACVIGLVMALAMAGGASLARQTLVLLAPSSLFPLAGSLAMASIRLDRDPPMPNDRLRDTTRREDSRQW